MLELRKEESYMFNEYYTGSKVDCYGRIKKVTCILDDNCVRFVVTLGGKRIKRSEYKNNNKELCFKNATKALNE